MLQIRINDSSLFLRGGRLVQQSARCTKCRRNHCTESWSKEILPSSYMGSPRDMYQWYRDTMALVQKYGKPDLFITITCNPFWDEIVAELLPGQSASDRPDLTTRVFRAKLEELKVDLFTKLISGRVAAQVHVVEFQKRGLPHIHMLIILRDEDKLQGPDDYDKIMRAELLKSQNYTSV
ncbi:hypothetical protein MKX01_000236 [Papaver californicum]|nr:hypothetical protein MKX01_000236 [Papaver californicum]